MPFCLVSCRGKSMSQGPLTLAQKRNNSVVWTGGEGYGGPLDATYELPYSTRKCTRNLSWLMMPTIDLF